MFPAVFLAAVFAQLDGGASLDAQARYLAALPDAGVPVLEAAPVYARHRQELDQHWATLERKRLAPMRGWAQAQLWPRIDPTRPVLYFFGGPDAISIEVLYPDAPVLVLCGLERPGQLAPLETLPPADLENALLSLRRTIRSTVGVSYFITERMGGDMLRSPLKGVLPVLLLFLARAGETVLEAHAVTLDEQGVVVELPAPPRKDPSGWRLRFRRGSGPVRELYYWRLDLSDRVVKKRMAFFAWLSALGPTNSFLKAASFILHDGRFSLARNHLLQHSASILEDDSGVPFEFLNTPEWQLTLFGAYSAPRGTFLGHVQPAMTAAWQQGPTLELPFATGYKHSGPQSHLLLAVKRAPVDAGTP